MANDEQINTNFVLLEIDEPNAMPEGVSDDLLEDFKNYARYVFPVARDFGLWIEPEFLSRKRSGRKVRAFLLQPGAGQCQRSVKEIQEAWIDFKAGYKALWYRLAAANASKLEKQALRRR